jgi:thiamine monophosphate kinase
MDPSISRPFSIGKLPVKALERLLKKNKIKDHRVIVGPGIGEDAAVIDIPGPRYLIAKTDPITFAVDQIGWYAVHINANDIATKGAALCGFSPPCCCPKTPPPKAGGKRFFKTFSMRAQASACRS